MYCKAAIEINAIADRENNWKLLDIGYRGILFLLRIMRLILVEAPYSLFAYWGY